MGVFEDKRTPNAHQQIVEDADTLIAMLQRTDPDCSEELFRSIQKLEKKLRAILKLIDDCPE